MTNKTTLLKTGLMLSVALVLTTAQSFAFTIDYTATPNPFTVSGNNGTTSVSLPSFDTTIGTLTEVDLSLASVDASGDVLITNTAGYAQPNVSGTINGFITVTDSASQSVSVSPSATLASQAIPKNQSVDFTFDSGVAPTQTTTLLVGTDDLTPYESVGASTVDLTVTGLYGQTITDEGNVSTVLTPSSVGVVDVVYTYTPVPEPAQTGAWMLAFGALVLGGRMYLKKKSLLAV